MFLITFIVALASLILYMGFKSVKTTNEKILLLVAYVLLLGIVMKYYMNNMVMKKETFISQNEEDFLNSVEELDKEFEEEEKFNNTTANNNDNANTFNPTLVVNVGNDETPVINNTTNSEANVDPFKPVEELFKADEDTRQCRTETFADESNNGFLPFKDNDASPPTKYNSRDFVPGMAFIPPTEWDVPQPHKTAAHCDLVCNQTMPDTRRLPIAMMDYGTPINALELGSDGMIAKREEDAPLTSVGSLMPKFEYREYVECHRGHTNKTPGVALTKDNTDPTVVLNE